MRVPGRRLSVATKVVAVSVITTLLLSIGMTTAAVFVMRRKHASRR
jgi:hypothetical protein